MNSVIAGHTTLHSASPSGHTGEVTFNTTSNGMQNKATIRSEIAKFTSRKLRVVHIRGVCAITRQTRVFPVTAKINITAKKVYSVNCSAVIAVFPVSVEFSMTLLNLRTVEYWDCVPNEECSY